MPRTASAHQVFEGSVHEAEAIWYETARWTTWVPGLERVEEVGAGWPKAGARVRWQSVPAGRGRVVERVLEYESLSGQTVEVEDDSIRGRQTVTFSPEHGKVAVALSLSYELKQRSPLMPLVDMLFIRRAMTRALEQTLARFGAELEGTRRPDLG
jgi:hypothetical protein